LVNPIKRREPTKGCAMTDDVLEVANIGLVGWGRMGGMMGQFALKAGWPVTAFDPSPDATAASGGVGARGCNAAGSWRCGCARPGGSCAG
jgi:phosphoglycerate dehydrogenase-like enzyme